ncbi:CXXC-type zinc finger protein 1 [Halyomorpha halys]|uniref:CXXC-type zinc finger protein 1 n=1 Tax=Halyomorpha halys TaxID=286706 RepID=UPI0006D50317|nr:CXXC-type zinc finger protein 1-like [Halyomorpha halys]
MPQLKLTPEEIARQFQLPERKSKIATLLKKDGQMYCICGSPDSSSFMIGCDLCDQWYHGDCIGITQKDSKNIKRYYCERCQEEDPTLKTVYKTPKVSDIDLKRDIQIKGRTRKDETVDPVYIPPKKAKISSTKTACGSCINCRKTSNCGSCHICKERKKSGSRRVKDKCVNRVCLKLKPSAKRHEYEDSSSDGEQNIAVGGSVKPGMQCYGPGCVETALPNSKYCSDKCGIKLATNRVFQVLPQRLQEWSMSSCYAENVNKKDLETVRRKQIEARAALHELDKRYQQLEMIIAKGKELEPCFKVDTEPNKKSGNKRINFQGKKENEREEEASVYCVTCGHEIHTSSAIKHMEKCFSKYESQASFGSMYKTRIEGNNMFCDFYNPLSKTYCKRLRVLCPEHTKDPIIGSNEACGCPIVKDVFEVTNELCTYPKKFCYKHHCWEKLRRAEIDMERVRQWLKVDELFEQERLIRQKMVQRAGVLALMLHSTYDHEAMEKMTSAQEEERLAQLEKTLRENYDKEQFENIKCTKENKKFFKSLKKAMTTS